MQSSSTEISTRGTSKILLLSHQFSPFLGGIEVISEVLATAFVAAGHEVHIVTWTTATEEKAFPFTIIRNPTAMALLREHRWADIVFENNPCLRLAWPTLFLRRPVVTALHTWITRADGSLGIQDKIKTNWWLRRSKQVVAISDALRRRSWPDAIIINNPYRSSDFQRNPAIAKSKDFLFLGRLVSDKGVQLAVQAIHELNAHTGNTEFLTPKPQLTIVGEGPERMALEQLVAKLRLQDQVLFTGSLKGEVLVECLNQHRFLLVPSLWEEPFGVVALEALACGCIPLVSDGGGLPEAVGDAGLTFKRGDVDALVACIRRVVGDPALEQRLLAAAPAHLAAHHSDIVARQYLAVFQECIS
jgi:glycosyltransferase involved in cell wall biosynthesis